MIQPRCPYCLDDIHPDDEPVRCAKCRTPHHPGCFAEHQVCVAYGCLSREEVPAGVSLFKRPAITVTYAPTRQDGLGPFVLGWKVLPSVPENRPPWRCPPEYARMSLEGREIREGEVVRGRAVIYTPRPLPFKRIDLCLLQGIARPEPVARVTLSDASRVDLKGGVLQVGTHPFYLELQAPPTTGPVDPFTFEVVLVRGLLRGEVRSLPLHLFLLEQRHAPPRAVERPQDPPRLPIRVGVRPEGKPLEEDDPFALPAGAIVRERQLTPPERDPALHEPRGGGWTELPVLSPTGIFGNDEVTGRTFAARFCSGTTEEAPLALHAPPLLTGTELAVRLTGTTGLGSLSMAVHYELVRPGGAEVQARGFPVTDEVRVLGHGVLDAARFGRREGVELLVRLAPARLQALARARAEGAHNLTLRIRIGLDAIEAGGRVASVPSRTVTYTGPVPEL